MRKPTSSELELIGKAALDRLGVDGAKFLDAALDLAAKEGWSLKELAAHLEGTADVVNGLIAGWVDDEPGGDR